MLLAGPQRLGVRPVLGDRIVANADRRPPRNEGPDRIAIGPSAFGKQQVQLGVKGALRL